MVSKTKEQIEIDIIAELQNFKQRIISQQIDISTPTEEGKRGHLWIQKYIINENFYVKIELSRID